jgi:hypothetical protein
LRAKVPIPEGGATAGELLHAAGVGVRQTGWDLFVNGARTTADQRVAGEQDATLSYSPRTEEPSVVVPGLACGPHSTRESRDAPLRVTMGNL